MSHEHTESCLCGSGKQFDICCGPYISGATLPATAEQLMRSRYTAFCRHDWNYLRATCHPDGPQLGQDPEQGGVNAQLEWTGLEVLTTEAGAPTDDDGVVDFVARYRAAGSPHALREKSIFKKHGGRWLYFSGKNLALPKSNDSKVGRNDPCPCGSGKKFKKCCGQTA